MELVRLLQTDDPLCCWPLRNLGGFQLGLPLRNHGMP